MPIIFAKGRPRSLGLSVPQGVTYAAPDIGTWNMETAIASPFLLDSGNEIIVTDATAPSPSHSLQMNWTVDGSGLGESNGVQARFDAQATTKLFLRFYYKQDATFDNSGVKKFCRFQGPGFTSLYGTALINHGVYYWTWDGDAPDWTVSSPTPDSNRNSWHCFEVMNDITTPNAYQAKMWIDGVLLIDTGPRNFSYGTGITLGTLDVAGIFNSPCCLGSDWLDNIAISTQRIGP